MNADLEFLRSVFADDRLHIGIGTITQLGLSQDQNLLRCQVNLLPENREVVCMMSWDDIGRITFPEVDDLVLVAFVDGHPDEAHVFRVLTNSDEPISAFARLGHTITNSRPGKKNYIGSDTKVGIGRIDVEPTEPLVLGNVMLSAITQLLAGIEACVTAINTMGNNVNTLGSALSLPPFYTGPAMPDPLPSFQSTYISSASSNIVSQIGFTERGS